MALQLGALRDALREAGAADETAGKAAEEVAGYETRLIDVTRDLSLLKWMVGTNLLLTVGIVGRSLFIH